MVKLDEILHHYPEISGVHEACLAIPQMSDEEFKDLCESIYKNGLLEPIVLTGDKLLLDGRHRLLACYEVMQELRFEYTSINPWSYVCDKNIQRRHLTVGQKAMFAQSWLEAEERLAKERQRESGGDRTSKTYKQKSISANTDEAVVPTLAQPVDSHPPIFKPASKARDETARKANVGKMAIDKAKKITEYAPSLADEVRSGKIDLEPAYREAKKFEKQQKVMAEKKVPVTKEMAKIVTLQGDVKEIPKPVSVKFNKTTDAVDWARWTWNPITGCLHGCGFCYAREIATSKRMKDFYPFGFEPAFHEYRLDAPISTPMPKSDDPRDKRVFVCSMADLFGKWVPELWIKKVFDACMDAPDWTYLFLTKWPNKYADLNLLPNAWFGASVVQQSDVLRIEKAMTSFENRDGIVKWVSMEPMLEPIKFNDLSWCDLMVIGSQTATNQPDGIHPAKPADFDAVVDVVMQCRESGVPYYLKANMGLEPPGMNLPKMSP